ncbi:sulfatase-like hydrolase/transferase [Ramlibacter sp. 2FC]|uniref:sulfatase family protein n=1 Tax=Ramlibacter sp. 2FC TaxID=2502188 RepID=UPI0010F58C4A|nr:sulfatase-like hydrolase/transferase [Ramlibacter sp. 2FC]
MSRPNFLLFVTDQQRADHLGCYGNPVVATPHVDALAKEGCVFDEFHVASPICQPNRASLMTGRMPSAHGVAMNGRELSFGETSFVEMLRAAGYRTGLVGKAHLQNITTAPAPWPGAGQRLPVDARRRFPGVYGQEVRKRWEDDPGFDLALPYYGFERVALTIGHADQQYGHWRRWLRAQTPDAERLIGPENAIPTPGLKLARLRQAWRTRVPEELYPTAYIAGRTCELLSEFAGQGQPFFLQCSFPDPHHPFTPPGSFWDLYRPQDMDLPPSFHARLGDPPPPVAHLRAARDRGQAGRSGHAAFACDEQEAREGLALNYGNIACVDAAVGRVLAQLRALGLDQDTVVLFTSDHGELLGDRQLMLKGGLHYRALTRVPLVWRDTAERRRAGRSQALAQTTDIAATVLGRAGLAPANGMHGRSLLDLIEGRAERGRERLVVEEEGQRADFGLARRNRLRSLLTGRHRLTIYDGQPWGELYDLQEDPLELSNLWRRAPALRAELSAQLAYAMLELADTSPYPEASA